MADDKLNSPESQSGDQTENQNPPEVEELESAKTRVIELERLIAQKDEELAKANARIAELEQAVTDIDNAMSQAVASYKALVIKANPGVPAELLSGDSIEAIDQSLENAKNLISRVRQGLEAEMAAAKVPAGAPQRTPLDLSVLSPREKIQYAIGGKK